MKRIRTASMTGKKTVYILFTKFFLNVRTKAGLYMQVSDVVYTLQRMHMYVIGYANDITKQMWLRVKPMSSISLRGKITLINLKE